jgi:hypothetical protein
LRDWCGSSLCAWTLDSGAVARVPTWNANDFGVSFTAKGTQISQATDEHDAKCLLFTTTADIDPSAQMMLDVDFNNDGTLDYTGPLGATRWHKVENEITAPPKYSGITFHLRKEGDGTAILAEMRVVSADDCTAAPSIAPLLLGEGCTADSQCATDLVCAAGHCGECDETRPCAGGGTCGAPAIGGNQCNPAQRLGTTGDPCVTGEDCLSYTCKGAATISLAAAFGVTDAGCSATPSTCTLAMVGAAPDAGTDPCACILTHGGTCQ